MIKEPYQIQDLMSIIDNLVMPQVKKGDTDAQKIEKLQNGYGNLIFFTVGMVAGAGVNQQTVDNLMEEITKLMETHKKVVDKITK